MHEQMNVSKETDERRIKNILTTKEKNKLGTEMKNIFYGLIHGFNRGKYKK